MGCLAFSKMAFLESALLKLMRSFKYNIRSNSSKKTKAGILRNSTFTKLKQNENLLKLIKIHILWHLLCLSPELPRKYLVSQNSKCLLMTAI